MNDGTILVVEDDVDQAGLMKEALQKAGIQNPVVELANGEELKAYLEGRDRFGDRKAFPLPVLVLLDLELPKVSGLDVLAWARARPDFRRIPFVVFTSSRSLLDMDRAYAAGANSYLVKPALFTEFMDMLKVTGSYWIRYNSSQDQFLH